MARRKFQFQPDREDFDLAGKLYITPLQRKKLLKWTLYTLSCIIALILQDSMLARVRIFGGVIDLAPCALVLICLMEGAEAGGVFILLGSMFFVFSGTAPGSYSVGFLTVYSVLAALFRENFLRRGLSSTWLCAGAVMILYELSVFAMGIFMGNTYPGRFPVFLATGLLAALIVPALYPQMRWIGKIGGETWIE